MSRSGLNFLGRIMDGNQLLISFVQRVIGYALTGDFTRNNVFFLFFSVCGANGKKYSY